METGGQHQMSSSIALHLFPPQDSLFLNLELTSWLGQQVPEALLSLPSPGLGLQVHTTGPDACAASALPTKLVP